jgi:hypothetical protein
MIGGRNGRDYSLYVDRRRGGETRWSLGPPRDALMRIPDGYLPSAVFFGGKDSEGRLHYRATAFFIGVPTKLTRFGGTCLVTARHNVEGALKAYGNVWVRLNTKDGGAMDIEITTPWEYPDDPASDVAAVPFWPLIEWEGAPLPVEWFVTQEVIETRGVGVGEELVVVGLFSHHIGTNRNLPIVRSGNIAAMPLEPLIDEDTGDPFYAYLAEVRSIGGLSGSPVLIALNPATRLHVFGEAREKEVGGWTFYLLGLIRGHWRERIERDFQGSEFGNLNSGIAMVTPITDVLPLLEREVFVEQRKEMDRIMAGEGGEQVKDLAAEESAGDEFERFEELTRKVVQVPKGELDEKRKDES